MAAIVYQTNKKTGIIYAYESISYWDKEKQQSRAKRKCIGRVDPETQKIIPTRKRKAPAIKENSKRGPTPITLTARRFYGATYLFDRIGKDTGIIEDLKSCFPENYRQILSIAYYQILEDKNNLSRFPRWAALHRHPHGEALPREAVSFSPRLLKRLGSVSLSFRENAGRKRNTWPTTAPPFPVIPNASDRSASVKTKTMNICLRSI